MKGAVWHKMDGAVSGIEVSKQRFMNLLALLGLAGITLALSTGKMALFALILVAPLVCIMLLAIVRNPMVMFFSVFVFNYFMIGIMRYVNVSGISVVMDVLLWMQLLLIIMYNVLKGVHNWKRAVNLLTMTSIVWTLYCLLEVINPSAVFEAWVMSRRLIYQGLIMSVIVSLLFTDFKQVRGLMILYSILTLFAVTKALMQKIFGFDFYEMKWLVETEAIRTHILPTTTRYFSFLSDAGNFGSNMGCAGIAFLLVAMYETKLSLRIYYLFVSIMSMYAMFLSGTRGAMIVPLAGLFLYVILSKNIKAMTIGGIVLVGLYVFFAFTYIGEGNPLIRRMRTAFKPTEDASFLVRMENQARLREYLKSKPFGEGIGLGGVESSKYATRVTTQIPHDSWYVKMWMETGIVGLILYVAILLVVVMRCCYIIMFKVKDKVLKGYLIGMLCGVFGMMVSAYGNGFLGQLPTMLIMYAFLAISINGDKIDSLLMKKQNI